MPLPNFFKLIIWSSIYLIASTSAAQSYVVKGLREADLEFTKKNYAIALETYTFYQGSDISNDYLNQQIALCYFHLRHFENAMNSFGLVKSIVPTIQIDYVKCMMANEKYAEVKAYISQHKESLDSAFIHLSLSCDSALSWQKNNKGTAYNIGMANSSYSDIAPSPYESGIVFCSNRRGLKIEKNSEIDGNPLYDLYFISAAGKGWSSPSLFSTRLNSTDHEGPVCFNSNNDTVYFSRNEEASLQPHLKMYRSIKTGRQWGKPQNFMLNDTSASFAHPSISGDGKIFFFTSDMKGGFGGTDIYACILIDSSWSMPINLGSNINTSGNEVFPFVNKEGHLYFASEGHLGMGGYDVFISTQQEGMWQTAQNLKSPVNTGADDFAYTESKEGKVYFTSNRKGGKGNDDIYTFESIK